MLMNKKLLSMLFVVAIASSLNARKPTIFVKNLLNKSFVRNTSNFVPKEIPNVFHAQVITVDNKTAYIFCNSHITKTSRSLNFSSGNYDYLNQEVKEGSEEYEKIKNEFLNTNKARKVVALKEGILTEEDVFPG